MNDFALDDFEQRQKRDQYLLPWYDKFAEATVVDLDQEFQQLGIDTILVYRKSRQVLNVEEKIVRWPDRGYAYDAFAFEEYSCTLPQIETLGWMFTGKACRLLYCFTQKEGWLDCYWIDFRAVQKWFLQHRTEFGIFRNKEKNRSQGRVVPIDLVERVAQTMNFELGAP
jgi:hypothetical protein